MTTIEQFARLAEFAPDVCEATPVGDYKIEEYYFWNDYGKLTAYCYDISMSGHLALDWLQCALQRAIKARGMYWELCYWKPRDQYKAEVVNQTGWGDTAADALLSALINALEVEK